MTDLSDSIGERLKAYLAEKGLSINGLARAASTSASQISNIVNGTKFGIDKLYMIFDTLPDLNPEWLLFGRGEMEKEGVETKNFQSGSQNIYAGKNVKQKNISGSHAATTPADNSNIEKLQSMLQVCEAEKAGLERTVELQKDIIELLKSQK